MYLKIVFGFYLSKWYSFRFGLCSIKTNYIILKTKMVILEPVQTAIADTFGHVRISN